mmetsp:Transcript_29371/g.70634  ORF Transcript_29371/g.70634 Transcript_29371/m.70634 type:complete len:240 (+) Transcript_29371:2146-2865(+)
MDCGDLTCRNWRRNFYCKFPDRHLHLDCQRHCQSIDLGIAVPACWTCSWCSTCRTPKSQTSSIPCTALLPRPSSKLPPLASRTAVAVAAAVAVVADSCCHSFHNFFVRSFECTGRHCTECTGHLGSCSFGSHFGNTSCIRCCCRTMLSVARRVDQSNQSCRMFHNQCIQYCSLLPGPTFADSCHYYYCCRCCYCCWRMIGHSRRCCFGRSSLEHSSSSRPLHPTPNFSCYSLRFVSVCC